MEIRPTNFNKVTQVYKQTMSAASTKSAEAERTSSNQDVISISEEGQRQSEFGKTVRTIAAEVNRDVPSARLSELRQAIQNGTYSVSSEMIALSILARISA